MLIRNVTSPAEDLSLPDLKNPQPYGGIFVLKAGATVSIYNEDAERSASLIAAMNAGKITNVGTAEPADGGPTADPMAAVLTELDDHEGRITALEHAT